MTTLCGRNCERCTFLNSSCGGCSMCEAALCNRNCNKCYSMCFQRPETAAYINHIGGTHICPEKNKDPVFKARCEFMLPVHIPVLPDRLKNKPAYDIMPIVGIHAGNAFARNGERINKSYLEKGFAGALNIDESTGGILEFYVKDRTLEGLWDKRKSIYPGLKGMNFTAVIAPNFSVYEDTPRIDHLYNIKRSIVVYNEMLDTGIPAIPDISWFNRTDLDRWCDEINKNNIKTISFSFQVVSVGLRASSIWKTSLLGLRYLCRNIKSDVNIIVAGLSSPSRIVEIFSVAGRNPIHVLNQTAYVQSRRGMLSETRQQFLEISFDELFLRNLNYFNKVYKELNNSFLYDQEENVSNNN